MEEATTRPTKRTRVALSEHQAWEIATGVGAPIRGHVRLAVDQPSTGIGAGTYEWLTLSIPEIDDLPKPPLPNALAWVHHAREACVVWYMLACCTGYGGHENACFWKRLVDHMAREPDARRDVEVEYVSDAHAFFPRHERVFPRFQLVLSSSELFESPGDGTPTADEWLERVVRAFVGLGAIPISAPAVQGYVRALLPHVDDARFFEQEVELSIVVRCFPLENLADGILTLVDNMEDQAGATPPSVRQSSIVADEMRFPAARITSFDVRNWEPLGVDSDLESLTDVLATCDMRIPLVAIEPSPTFVSDDVLTTFLLAMDHEPARNAARVEVLSMELPHASRRQVEILFSSLLVMNVQTLCVRGTTRDDGTVDERRRPQEEDAVTMDEHAWTWLAYILYHPHAVAAPFAHLEIEDLDVSEPTAAPIQSVLAAQAAMYRLVHVEADDSLPTDADRTHSVRTHYALVDIARNTACFTTRTLRREMFYYGTEATVAAVVKFSVREMAQLPDVVCVIVPYKGHAWIQKNRITKLTLVPTQSASITSLVLGVPQQKPAMPLSVLRPLVSSVTCLDMAQWGRLTAEQLINVLRLCPTLKQLRVQHRGELFHDWNERTIDNFQGLGQVELETLWINCDEDAGSFLAPSKAAWQTCLRRLSVLTITTEGPPPRHQLGVREALLRGNPVESFLWNSNPQVPSLKPATYDENLIKTRQLLAIADGQHDKAHRPVSREARLAVTSVIKQKARGVREREDTSLEKLSDEIVRLIGQFAVTKVDRSVWVC